MRKRTKFLLLILILLSTSFGFQSYQRLEAVTLDRKISQMVVLGYNGDDDFNGRLQDIKEQKISGVLVYKRDIKSRESIKARTALIYESAVGGPKPIIMLDQEGGAVSRIDKDNGFKHYPSATKVANGMSVEEAYQVYYDMAKDLHDVGFNFNLAPCVDLGVNPKSSLKTRNRTYSNNADITTAYAKAFIAAHNANNVVTTLKHYPGIGSTAIDTHHALPNLSDSWRSFELLPFENIIKEYPTVPVMAAHVLHRKFDEKNPISLSKTGLDVLRRDLKHEGVVVIDAVNMGAIGDYSIEPVIVNAINAGVDIFIFPNHSYSQTNDKVYMRADRFNEIVHAALERGEISKKQINRSYKKIIALKKHFRVDR